MEYYEIWFNGSFISLIFCLGLYFIDEENKIKKKNGV